MPKIKKEKKSKVFKGKWEYSILAYTRKGKMVAGSVVATGVEEAKAKVKEKIRPHVIREFVTVEKERRVSLSQLELYDLPFLAAERIARETRILLRKGKRLLRPVKVPRITPKTPRLRR